MPAMNGRDFLIKIGDGGGTEVFTTIGSARASQMSLNNNPVDATSLSDNGVQVLSANAGTQTLQITLEGVFKDAVAEELLRSAAFARTQKNFQLIFPNGDMYQAGFIIQEYSRGGSHDNLESFSATLARTGAGTYTAG